MRVAALGISVVLTLLAAPAMARCSLDMSYRQCIADPDAATAETRQTAQALAAGEVNGAGAAHIAALNTGPADSGTQNDFAAKLGLALDHVDYGGNGQAALTVDWNGFLQDLLANRFFDLLGDGEWQGGDHKLTLRINDPQLFEPLSQALDDAQRTQLGAALGDFSDSTWRWSYSPASKRQGRRFSSFGDEFNELFNLQFGREISTFSADSDFGQIYGELRATITAEGQLESDLLRAESVATGRAITELGDVSLRRLREACQNLAPEACPHLAVDSLIEQINLGQGDALVAGIQQRLNSGIFKTWQQLISNQPQLVLSVEHTNRSTLAGRDETTGKLSWERSAYNMSSFLAWKDRASCGQLDVCLTHYSSQNAGKIEAAPRISLALEYVHKEDYAFAGAGMPALTLDDEQSLVVSAAASRNFSTSNWLPPSLTQGHPGRVELKLSYDDVDNDPQRNDRFLANLLFTQQIHDGTMLTLGFVYSSKPEYRGQVDKEVSARFGVNYKFGANQP